MNEYEVIGKLCKSLVDYENKLLSLGLDKIEYKLEFTINSCQIAGQCCYSWRDRPARIRFNLAMAMLSEENCQHMVNETVPHELCHMYAGPGVGHGLAWQLLMKAIGKRPVRCHKMQLPERHEIAACHRRL